MERKSIYTREYAAMLELLRETRHSAGVSQVQLADRLKRSQSFVSKIENGETRLDVIQLCAICHALETTLTEFIGTLEDRLVKRKK